MCWVWVSSLNILLWTHSNLGKLYAKRSNRIEGMKTWHGCIEVGSFGLIWRWSRRWSSWLLECRNLCYNPIFSCSSFSPKRKLKGCSFKLGLLMEVVAPSRLSSLRIVEFDVISFFKFLFDISVKLHMPQWVRSGNTILWNWHNKWGISTTFTSSKTNHLNPIVDRVDHWIFFLWEFWIIFIQYVLDIYF